MKSSKCVGGVMVSEVEYKSGDQVQIPVWAIHADVDLRQVNKYHSLYENRSNIRAYHSPLQINKKKK